METLGFGIVDGEEGQGGGDFKAGAGGEAAADGDIGRDEGVHAKVEKVFLAEGFRHAFGIELRRFGWNRVIGGGEDHPHRWFCRGRQGRR